MSEQKKSDGREKRRSSSSKASIVVALRNKFFFVLYRYATLVFLSSLACFALSVFFLLFFARQPIPPQYIAINEDGTYINLSPITECSKSEADVLKFVSTAIRKMYKYDYINYGDQLQEAAPFFTSKGWNEFLDAFNNSNTLSAVKENKWVVTVTPEGLPQILKKGNDANQVCYWDVEAKISVSYIGNSGIMQRGKLHFRVVRESVINNPEGLGISVAIFVPSDV